MVTTFRAPGVYVIEDQSTPMPLTGVPTGIPCFFGFTQQGPSLKPTRITSMNEYYAVFGKKIENTVAFKHSYMADSLYGFFLNGGSECYICRVNNGEAATWPVKWIQEVVDFKKLDDEFDPSTPESPALMSLTVRALSGGTWANKLLVKIRKAQNEGPLPLITAEIRINQAPDAPKLVRLDQLDPTGSTPIPSAGVLREGTKLELSMDGEAVQGTWSPAKDAKEGDAQPAGFACDKPLIGHGTGTITFSMPGPGGTTKEILIPVKFTADTSINPIAIQVLEGGDFKDVTEDDQKLWNAKTTVQFDNVTVGDQTLNLLGVWDKESESNSGNFFITDSNGNQFVLCKETIGDGVVLEGKLHHPLRLPDGYSLSFDLQVLEPVSPRNPGGQETFKILENFQGLSTNPKDPSYYLSEGLINGVSNRIVVEGYDATAGTPVAFGDPLSEGDKAAKEKEEVKSFSLSDPGAEVVNHGDDQTPPATAYLSYFQLLKQIPDVSLISCPDAFVNGVTTPANLYQPIFQAAIDYCEENRCMVVVDCPPQAEARELGDLAKRSSQLEEFADRFRSTHAAIYSPWLQVSNVDPEAESKTKYVPPSGFMLGAYNRSDDSVGVWKAPANMPLLGPVGLQLPFTEDESEILNPAGVNLIRSFPGFGLLIWGARTTTKNVMWQYVNVRRLFLYVERTLKQQTMWAVFESNDQRTWNKLVNSAENFLRALWLDGGLMGATPEEAFRVQCGVPQTMTMTDVETGVLKVEVAIAPVRPAEFVVFTVSQLVQTAQSG